MEMVGTAHVADANGTTIAWGEMGSGDPLVLIPLRHGREALCGFTGVSLTTYPDSGHFPHLDVPARFARDLGAFLHDPERRPARRPPRRDRPGGKGSPRAA